MKLKTNILILIITVGFIACSPQIRFTSKSDVRVHKKITSGNKSNIKPINDAELISEILNKMKNTVNNLENNNSELINNTKFRIDIIERAKQFIGTPYCWGGENSNCTDCSGFVSQVFQSIGIILPRTAAEQYNFGTEISDNDLQAGDLVFFIRNNKIGHVGIYLGNNKFIHSSSSKGVTVSDLNDKYYRTTYAGARRIFGNV